MIEKIDLKTFEIVSNHVLIKLDRNYDFIEVHGPDGIKVELQLIDFTATQEQLQAITGTVLKVPNKLKFHAEIKQHERGLTISSDEYSSIMRNTMPFDVPMNITEGDKVTFDLKEAIGAELTGLLVNVGESDYAVLMPYESLFCKEVDGNFIPLNGWVFFKRDQKPGEFVTESGLVIIEKVDKYGSKYCTVICADAPIKEYIEKGYEDDKMNLHPEDRIFLQKGFGFRIAMDRFAGGLKDIEGCRRTRILAKFDNA